MLFGAIFITVVWVFIPQMPIFYLVLIFLASFLIDFDHYTASVFKTKKLGLRNAFKYHKEERKKEIAELKQGIKRRGDFHLFHTIEFHAVVGLLSLLWIGFFYIFMGMVFHSLLDVFSLLFTGFFHRRDFFLFSWAKRSKKN